MNTIGHSIFAFECDHCVENISFHFTSSFRTSYQFAIIRALPDKYSGDWIAEMANLTFFLVS